MTIKPRDVTPVIAIIRDWFGFRKLWNMHRFEGYNIKPRNLEDAKLPSGIYDKLKDNSYCLRDGRGLSEPPSVAYTPQTKIGDGSKLKFAVPGKGFDWNQDTPLAKRN